MVDAGNQLELTRGTVARDGESIYWELAQAGPDDDRPVIVLSHGAGGSHAVWYQQIPALGRTHRVLTWDSRGFGNSTNDTDSPSPEAAAEDLAAVLDHVGVESAHLVGQSMGGWHIAAFAIAHPTRIRSLTFADTIGGMWTDELRTAFEAVLAGRGLDRSGPQPIGRHPALWPGTGERSPAHAFLYEALGSFHNPPMHRLGETLSWSVPHTRIADLGVPTLFVAGAHDALFPADLLAASCALLPGAEFVEIADAGHSPYFEQPDAWNAAVADFVSKTEQHD